MSVIDTDSAEHYIWGEQCDGWHLVKTKMLSIIEERMPSGCSETAHYHQYAEQYFHVISGCASMQLGDQIVQLTAGQGIHVAAGTIHQISNMDKTDLCFLVTSTPPSHQDRIEV